MAKNIAALKQRALVARNALAEFYNGERDMKIYDDSFMFAYLNLQKLVAALDQYLADVEEKKCEIKAVYSANEMIEGE